jgi:outer membrane protein OmpA-like peptidoglycan-associated protein
MKTITKLVVLIVVLANAWGSNAQTHKDHNYWQLSPRIGYDMPTINNNTPFIDYNGGLELGLSVDYYWKWFGLGLDVDYIKNSPESTFPTDNLFFGSTQLTDFSLTEDGITRLFYGIGPNFQYVSASQRFKAELNLRGGLASISGGLTELRENTVLNDRLNFHQGYDQSGIFTTKAQLRFTYFFNQTFGIHAGAYYMRHFGVEESLDSSGVAAQYYEVNELAQGNDITGNVFTRDEACVHDISSVGVFAGLTIKLKPKHTTECCTTCAKYALAVTARDKFTKQVLPDTDIALKDKSGNILQTGTTNSFGIVVFDDIERDDYVINGQLYDVALSDGAAGAKEFVEGDTLQKEILYEDENFILEGKAVVCNTATGLPGVDVILKNLSAAEQKSTITDAGGKYILHIGQGGTYELRGKKDNYFSQRVTINPSEYDRNTTLFVKLEICLEEAECGKAITLQNILYDLDKYFIRIDAQPELNRLAQFMKDNPSIRVEVSSHTDSRASDAYNQTLSQNRANAAVDYVVSQGVPRSQISGRGYGESRLLNECADGVSCSEVKHQINRRTEMKVICN